ncbi:unnamed protein product [Jaminaea pallidilutea]
MVQQSPSGQEPFAADCIFTGSQQQKDHRISSLAVHGEKLYVGTPSGSLSVYRLPSPRSTSPVPSGSSSTSSSAVASTSKAAHVSTYPSFHPANRSVLNLKIVPSLSLILSTCPDGALRFSSLATLEAVPAPSPLEATATKGVLAYDVQTSVLLWPSESGEQHITGDGRTKATNRGGQTLPRGSTLYQDGNSSKPGRPFSTFGRRQSNRKDDSSSEKLQYSLRLVTTVVVSVRRKVVVVRWLDGEPWDWKEVALPHTPRALALPLPASSATPSRTAPSAQSKGGPSTHVFMSYGTSGDFGILDIPPAHASSASQRQNGHGDFTRDDSEWRGVQELNIPEYSSAAHRQAERTTGPDAPSSASAAGGLFGGLGGYIGLGGKTRTPLLRPLPRPSNDLPGAGEEVLVVRDNSAVFLSSSTGNPTRRRGLEWPTPVEDLALLPSGHVFSALSSSQGGRPSLQVQVTQNFELAQTISLPTAADVPSSSSSGQWTISPLITPATPSSSSSSSLYAIVTPSSSSVSARIYKLTPRPWRTRLGEMLRAHKWSEAVELVKSSVVDESDEGSETKTRLLVPLLALVSLQTYLNACVATDRKRAQAGFEAAVDSWIEQDINPAKVLSIFPESIAGHGLPKEPDDWLNVWGGELEAEGFKLSDVPFAPSTPSRPVPSRRGSTASSVAPSIIEGNEAGVAREKSRLTSLLGRASRPTSVFESAVAPSSPPRQSARAARDSNSSDSVIGNTSPSKSSERPSRAMNRTAESTPKRNATASPAPPSAASEAVSFDTALLLSRPSLEALGRYLADRRRIFKPILESNADVTPTPHEAILSLPSMPLPNMSLPDLTALARVVDTALFKTFLETKPSLVGPLCRIQNWCEVNEVEGLLEAKGRSSELIHLYGGKDMHDRALKLLRKFAETEEDEEEKVGPTIRYLQNLGPEHIAVILENAKWVIQQDRERGIEIFTADIGKVSSLPRLAVVKMLASLDDGDEMCARFLEHIINEVGDGDPEVHERLAFIYLRRVRAGQSSQQLLDFLVTSQQYRPERLLAQVPSDGLWEVRALLLGRMGQHRGALNIYVERIGGEEGERKAEDYCSIVAENAQTDEERNIFLLLFKLYLHHAGDTGMHADKASNIGPALALLSRHASSLDLAAVLELLPPLVPLASIHRYLIKGLKASHRQSFDARVLSSVSKERDLQLDETLAAYRGRRVKITQGRTCPVCGKRLGVSVIAVSHRGEVVHYGCKRTVHEAKMEASTLSGTAW